jgi:Flp pilus assembly protein TadD
MRNVRFFPQFLVLCVVLALNLGASPTEGPDKDPRMASLLQDARQLIDAKKPGEAIELCDKVVAGFKASFGDSKQKVYCARTSAESLNYLLKAAADKVEATVLSPTWAAACFMKAYALQDLGRTAEAKTAVQQAIALSPANSQYRSELGTLYQLEKNWAKAKEQFEAAEENARLSPEKLKAAELGRARRGLGYVFVELGKLDEAEQKYRQCLADDPNDTRAKRELQYVQSLRAKGQQR